METYQFESLVRQHAIVETLHKTLENVLKYDISRSLVFTDDYLTKKVGEVLKQLKLAKGLIADSTTKLENLKNQYYGSISKFKEDGSED